MFGWEFPPNISGGLGTACYGIVKGLGGATDVHVTFVIPKSCGNELRAGNLKLLGADKVLLNRIPGNIENWSNIQFVEVRSQLLPYLTPQTFSSDTRPSSTEKIIVEGENVRIKFSGKYGSDLFDEINNYATVAQTIAAETSFDVIHAHDWLTFRAAIAAKRISGKPLIVHVHSTDFDRSGGVINPDIYNIERQGMEVADHIIAVSNKIKSRLIEQYHITPSKITTIYNGIDWANNAKKQKRSKEKIVTFLGRITIQKGPEYFVDVARLVVRKLKNVHFVMAGDGELKDRILELSVRFGISDKFHFTGFLNGAEVSEMLSRTRVFIMPSVSEPFGIVPLEAMQARVPVIISIQSGVAELIKHVIKTDFWDVNAMADAVYGILKYKRLAKSMIDDGSAEVQLLNWENPAVQISEVYRKTLLAAS